jgi:NDP-sugar pyrophosphorylase family protein
MNTAVILCGGLGKRLRPLTNSIPKPLLPVGNSTVLEIIINYLIKNNFKKIIIATRYKTEKFELLLPRLKRIYKKITFILNEEKKKLGTCGPVKYAEKMLPQKFLVINGDIITNLNVKNLFKNFINSKDKFLAVSKDIITPFEFGKIIIKKKKIIRIQEKPSTKNTIIAGIYLLDKICLKYIPVNTYYGMDDLIKFFLKKKISLSTHLMKNEFWLDIGRQSDYEKIKKKF